MSPFPKYTLQDMEDMSVSANEELDTFTISETSRVSDWWKSWYLKVGHKRLGRALIKKSKGSTRNISSNSKPRIKVAQSESTKRGVPDRLNDSAEKYRILSRPLSDPVLFSFESNYPHIAIILNTNHPMYGSVISQVSREIADHSSESGPLIALLTGWSYVEAQNQSDMTRFHMQEMRYDLSRSLANGRVSKHVELD